MNEFENMSHALISTAPIAIGDAIYEWNGYRHYELLSGPDVLRQADEPPRDGYAHADFLERARAWGRCDWGYGHE